MGEILKQQWRPPELDVNVQGRCTANTYTESHQLPYQLSSFVYMEPGLSLKGPYGARAITAIFKLCYTSFLIPSEIHVPTKILINLNFFRGKKYTSCCEKQVCNANSSPIKQVFSLSKLRFSKADTCFTVYLFTVCFKTTAYSSSRVSLEYKMARDERDNVRWRLWTTLDTRRRKTDTSPP